MESVHKHTGDPLAVIRRHAPYLFVIFLVTVVLYAQTLSFDFLTNWDDPLYITKNEVVRKFSFHNIIKAFTLTWSGNYAPLQILSYMIDHALWGMNAWGFHLTSMLLHAANSMLVYLFVTRISDRSAAGLIAGLLFAVHPVQVESVIWLSQRKNLLAMFFFLISFLLYLRTPAGVNNNRVNLLLSYLSFAASLLSKSIAIVMPLCLGVYETIVKRAVPEKKLVRKLIPYLGAAVIIALLTLYLQKPEMGGGRVPYHGGSLWATMLTMIPVFVRYLIMLVWPSGLCVYYIPPIKTYPDVEVIGAALVLAAVCGAGVMLYRHQRPLFFWYCMFFIPLIPVSQIVPLVTLMNDRYLYFPMIGAAGLAGHSFALLVETPLKSRRALLQIVAGAMIVALGITTYQQSKVWRNAVSLWSDAGRKNPGNLGIMSALAFSYRDAGRIAEAVDAYRTIFSLKEEFIEPRQEQGALRDAALLFMSIGSFDEARSLLVRLTTRFPTDASAFANLADCLSAMGEKNSAENAYLQALKLEHNSTQAMVGLATLLLDRKQAEGANELLTRAVDLGIDGPDLRVALARVAVQNGNHDQALNNLEQAIRQGLLNPSRLRLVPDFSSLVDEPRFRKLTKNDH